MNEAGDNFLATPALAQDEHRHVYLRHELCSGAEPTHNQTAGDEKHLIPDRFDLITRRRQFVALCLPVEMTLQDSL